MQLIFVYNADSGSVNAVIDSLHKIMSPQTYDCKLCELTFGVFAEREAWKKFRRESPHQMRFLHRDEFTNQYRSKWLASYTFPVVLLAEGDQFEIVITREDFASMSDTNDLIKLLKLRLSPY